LICPVTCRIEEKTKLTFDRFYLGKGKPAVKVGRDVSDIDIIAHCEVSAGQRLIKIAHVLGVSGKNVQKYLTRKIGDKVYEGEIIAKKRNLFGLGKREIKAPVDGLITEIDKRGDLILKFLPAPVRLLAGATGKIREITESKISIYATGTKIHGFISGGRPREGIITLIADPKEFIFPNKISADSKGKILVGGALLEKSALEKAVTLGVEGIITGGMNYRDFENLGGGDIGTTIIITEGFGSAPMGDDIWQYLKKKEGTLGFIEGDKNQLIITETTDSGEEKSSVAAAMWREVRVGDKVRYLRKESSDLWGVVQELPGEQIINSGILTEVARVAFTSKQEMLLPSANLEIIE